MSKKGLLIVISGFSGAGKGTVVKKLVSEYGHSLSISATTRNPREGEVDGVDYYFKTKHEFENLIDYNGLIEWAEYVDNYYGTPRAFVEREMSEGKNVILEIEVQGALSVKEQYKDAVLIFISAPSIGELEKRLTGRGTEDEATVKKRLMRATEEVVDMENYEYIVVNDDIDECVKNVNSIIVSENNKVVNNQQFINKIKNELSSL